MLRSALKVELIGGYPPFDIKRPLEDAYQTTLAVAGSDPMMSW